MVSDDIDKIKESLKKMSEIGKIHVETSKLISEWLDLVCINISKLGLPKINILKLIPEIPIPKLAIPQIDKEFLDRIKERFDFIEKSDFEYKWLGSISIELTNVLEDEYKRNGNEGVRLFLIELFRDEDNMNSFKELFKETPDYKIRKQIIDDALQAHVEGKFTLSIPVLLAQCDGILIHAVKKAEKYQRKDKKVNTKKIVEDKKIEIEKHLANQLEKMYGKRRHEILHGTNPYYFINKKDYGEELSIKTILTLFEVLNLASEIK